MQEQLDLFLATNQDIGKERTNVEEPTDRIDIVLPKKKLNERQKALFRLIRHNSLEEHRKTTQKEICEKLKDYGYKWNDDIKAHDHCTMVWSDVTACNLSVETHKLIIPKNFEYWIGNERETKEYLDEYWDSIVPSLFRYRRFLDKVNQDGQGTLFDCNGKLIGEKSKAERFIEAFNDYDIELQRGKNHDK